MLGFQKLKSIFLRTLLRLWIKSIAVLSRAITKIRHPHLSTSPDIFVKYYTEEQKAARSSLKLSEIDSQDKEDVHVLVIVPFRDKWEMTRKCLLSLTESMSESSLIKVTIALVDNGSVERVTHEGIASFMSYLNDFHTITCRSLRYDIPFNFSRLNNLAFEDCRDLGADYVLCLNNDIEIITKNFLDHFISFSMQNKNVGSIGCTLLYPNLSIQHLFVFVGCKIIGAHPFRGKKISFESKWFQSPQPVSAVTGACLFMKASVFDKLGGFDENLANCYQDVDLCLGVESLGLTNWVLPQVKMIHFETQTRRPVASWSEVGYMMEKWGIRLSYNRFISEKFSRWSESISLDYFGTREYPVMKISPEISDHIGCKVRKQKLEKVFVLSETNLVKDPYSGGVSSEDRESLR